MRKFLQAEIGKSNDLRFFNEHQLAAMLNISVATLRRWRLLGYGPKFIKLGAAVRYQIKDVNLWLSSQPAGGFRAAAQKEVLRCQK
jgi:hypothetical protein